MHLESNPIPTRNAQRAQTNLCAPGPRDPTETETELCPECHLRRFRAAVTAAGTGALGAADLGVA